ncbi:MAG: sulfatase-like hydrolase/transferase [Planctomycetaceae bacterium]
MGRIRNSLFRHRRVIVVIALMIAVVAGIGYLTFIPARPLNLLLITLDTTRADRLGYYGYDSAITPVLDQLARDGVLFERAYAPVPLTLPSHASVLTGLYPPEHGLRINGVGTLPAGLPTLATQLQFAGYDTGAFVAAVVLDKKYGLARGFTTYNDDISPSEDSLDDHHQYRPANVVINAALDWIKPRSSQPHFCWIHLFDPHFPYLTHEEHFGNRFANRPYDAELSYVDLELGRLFAELKAAGTLENTLIVIVGDHGESLGEHGELAHSMTVYNATLQVPLLILHPGKNLPGHRVAEPVSLVDICPTVLDCLGQEPLAEIGGRSLRPALQGEPLTPQTYYAETDQPYQHSRWSPLRALVTTQWKYIRSPTPELYDLSNDPRELENLAEVRAEVVQHLERQLVEREEQMKRRVAENVALTDQDRRDLNSLGYTTGSTATADDLGELPDVKDKLPYYNKLNDANAMMEAGRYDLAEPVLREIVEADANYFLAQGDLGRCLLRLNKVEEAIGHLRKNVELDPEADRVRGMLGAALLLIEDYQAAEEQLRIAVRSSPDLQDVRFNLGYALEKLNKLDAAAEQYEICLKQQTDFEPARQRLDALSKP